MPWGLAISPHGDRAYVVNRASSAIRAIDLATTLARVVTIDREPVEVAIAPDGRMAYVTSTIDNAVVPIELPTLEVLPSIPVGLFPRGIAITPDGRTIFVANSNADTLSVIDLDERDLTATIEMGVNAIPTSVAITPDGSRVIVGTHAGDVHILDALTRERLLRVAVGGQALRLGIGPSMIVASQTGASFAIGDDEGLDAFGFGRYIPFNGGVLRATGHFSTRKRLSMLAAGGAIDTQQYRVEMAGGTTNDGVLVKQGRGVLILGGVCTHPLTRVEEGTLVVRGTHMGRVTVGRAAVLAGTGSVGDVEAGVGMISPGDDRPGTLHARHLTMGPGSELLLDIGGGVPGQDGDRLTVDGTAAIDGATLHLRLIGPAERGCVWVIVNNALGTFAGLPEGAVVKTSYAEFRITYAGGRSGRDVTLTAC
jgi:YVTN family beta-propeller protein